MVIRFFILVSMLNMPSMVYPIDRDLLYRAIQGERQAGVEVAAILNDENSPFYKPDKAHEMYLKLANIGDKHAYGPLTEAFSDPMRTQYAPHRALFYANKSDSQSGLQKLFYQFLSSKHALDKSNDYSDFASDPFFSVVETFKHYPFTNLAPHQIAKIKSYMGDKELQKYIDYVYPAILTPVIANVHLYELASLPSSYFYFDAKRREYIPLVSSNGVQALAYNKQEGSVTQLALYYDSDKQSALTQYYESFLFDISDIGYPVFSAPGVRLSIISKGTRTMLLFEYSNLPPLVKPAPNNRKKGPLDVK